MVSCQKNHASGSIALTWGLAANRMMNDRGPEDGLSHQAKHCLEHLVHSIGVKRFAQSLGVSTRQVNRMLSGAQPNPVERLIRALQSADPEAGNRALDFICEELGGRFVRGEALNDETLKSVNDCAAKLAKMQFESRDDETVRHMRETVETLSTVIASLRTDDADTDADSSEAAE